MESENVEDLYLELTENPVRFEAVNQLVSVFFDDSNKQVDKLFFYTLKQYNLIFNIATIIIKLYLT